MRMLFACRNMLHAASPYGVVHDTKVGRSLPHRRTAMLIMQKLAVPSNASVVDFDTGWARKADGFDFGFV